MTNPIRTAVEALAPGYALTRTQEGQIDGAEDPQAVASALPLLIEDVRGDLAAELAEYGVRFDDITPAHALSTVNLDVPVRGYPGGKNLQAAKRMPLELLLELILQAVPTEEDFVEHLYRKHLNRDPDQEGQTFWETEWERQFVDGIKAAETA